MPGSDKGEEGKKLYVEQGYFMPLQHFVKEFISAEFPEA